MPVTKTAKRALRSSDRKASINKTIIKQLEVAIRQAKRTKTATLITKAASLIDRAAKRKVIHKNKAGRLKSTLSKLAKPAKITKKTTKKSSKKK